MIATILSLAVLTCPLQQALRPQANLAALPSDDGRMLAQASGDAFPGMVPVPGGEVVVGTDPKEVERLGQRNQLKMTQIAAETPEHTAQVEPFMIDRTEVTNLQWKVYLDATGRKPTEVLVEVNGWTDDGSFPDGEDYYPVTNVNIPELMEYLAWCGKRLPTEYEWVRAARGDDDRDYPWGPKWNSKLAQTGGSIPQVLVEVGQYEEGGSPYGALDMAGNAMEWTASPFVPFEDFEPIRHMVGRKRLELTPEFDRRRHVCKGGNYVSTREDVRIDARLPLYPEESDLALGFRCARSMDKGVDFILAGYNRLRPSKIKGLEALDMADVFAREDLQYDSARRVVRSYRCIAFAHMGKERLPALSSLKRNSVDEPVTLGLLTTSEALESPALPRGEYLVAFKAKGESKAYKDAKRERKKNGTDDEDEAPPTIVADGEAVAPTSDSYGAAAPWPGVGVSDIVKDIEFPQNEDVFLFYNVNLAAVGWVAAMDVREEALAPMETESSEEGRSWEIEFSLDTASRRVPRFTLPLLIRGEGFADS